MNKTENSKIECEFCGCILDEEQLENSDSMCDCYLYSQIRTLKRKLKKARHDLLIEVEKIIDLLEHREEDENGHITTAWISAEQFRTKLDKLKE